MRRVIGCAVTVIVILTLLISGISCSKQTSVPSKFSTSISTSEPMKTYTNLEYGYSIQYPISWEVRAGGNSFNTRVLKENGDIRSSVTVIPLSPTEMDTETYAKKVVRSTYEDISGQKARAVTFKGNRAFEIDFYYDDSVRNKEEYTAFLIVYTNEYVYAMSGSFGDPDDRIMVENIFSSFQTR